MKLSEAKVDVEAEDNGEWRELTDFPGVYVKVRSLSAPDFRNAINARTEKTRQQHPRGIVPPTVREQIHGEEIAKRLWMDVSGLEDDDGNEITLTRETAVALMTEREYRKIASNVVEQCEAVGNEAERSVAEDQGNSATGTSGKRSTATAKNASAS